MRATCRLARSALESGQPDRARKLFYSVLAREDRLGPEDRDLIAEAVYGVGDTYTEAGASLAREQALAPARPPEGEGVPARSAAADPHGRSEP